LLMGFCEASATKTTSGAPNVVLIAALWPLPETTVTDAAGPGLFVNEKLALPVAPVAVAVTVYGPAFELAVNVGDMACPFAPVITMAVALPPAKVPLAPLPGAVKVTETPLSSDVPVTTVATRTVPKGVLIVALCPDPPVAEIVSWGGVVELLELQLIEPASNTMKSK